MPNIKIPLPETQDSVTRPLALGLSRKLMKQLGIGDDVNIDYPGPEDSVPQQNSTVGEGPNKNYLGTSENMEMIVKEDYIRDRILEASVLRRDNAPYFADKDLFVYLRPIYAPTEVTLTFRYRTQDEVKARRWRDDIRGRAGLLRSEMVYKVDFHHPVPKEFLVILHEIYRLREAQAGYGDTYQDWLRACFDPRVTALSNQTGSQLLTVIPETAVQILGSFNFVGVMEEPEYNKDNGTWMSSFDYTFVYDKPVEGSMTYPLMIHNQLLSEKYRPSEGDYNLADEAIVPHHVGRVFNQFTDTYKTDSQRGRTPRVPVFDTWWPELDDAKVTPMFIGLVGISEDDKRTLLDLKDLGDYDLSEEAIQWLLREYAYAAKERRSLINVALFVNDARNPVECELTEDLVFVAKEDLDLRQVYHVRVGYLNDLTVLQDEDGERIRGDACLAYILIAKMFPSLAAAGLIPMPTQRCRWSWEDWKDLSKDTSPDTNLKPNYSQNMPGLMQTVNTGWLIARRKVDAVS